MFFLKELPSRRMLEGYGSRYPEMDAEAVSEALAMMRRASLLIRELEAYFSGFDLSMLRFHILMVIDREPDRSSLTMGEIIERIDVSKPVMTRTIRSLESDRLIAIAVSARDRRSKTITLTEHGKEVLGQVLPGYFRLIGDFERAGDDSDTG